MVIQNAIHTEQIVHVRFEGRSFDMWLMALEVTATASDQEILRALARRLEVDPSRLDDYVVDRHRNGNLTVRPLAEFG